jgi:penicillin amidase
MRSDHAVAARFSAPFTALLAGVVLAGALYIGAVPLGPAPALGRFLDPAHGVWAVARGAAVAPTATGTVGGLGAGVEITYDDRGVPHIFARSRADAWRALGYVHARDRLFQMELQTRAVAGTLAGLVGDRALPLDREARAQGLAWGAERSFREHVKADDANDPANPYADGVNAYIAQMTDADLPLELHLLGAQPAAWKPVYSYYLLSRMGLTLAYSEDELQRAQVEALVGKASAASLFPSHSPIVEPIQPNGQTAPRVDGATLVAPGAPDTSALAVASDLAAMLQRLAGGSRVDEGELVVGSNNWAVAPRRSASAHALLAGDPHLALSLPSIWYEAHIVVPDTLDVYGVTIPGAPVVPIGFNRDIAWSATNTGADVADYFVETVDRDASPTQYKLDGGWKPLEQRVEVVRGKGGRVISTDTIYHTHRGPMLRAGHRWVSRRWTVLDSYDAVKPLNGAIRARSLAEFQTVMVDFFAPAQNYVIADRGGHIGIRSTGHYPVRVGDGRGDVLRDGSLSSNDWRGYRPLAEYPQVVDPPQGYVASANQEPKDGKVDPSYFGIWGYGPWRAMRINALLRADSAVTPDAMRRYQTDPYSAQTQPFVRAFLAAADGSTEPAVTKGAAILRSWDGSFAPDNERAVLFEAVLDELNRRTWDELVVTSGTPQRARRAITPGGSLLLALLNDPTNAWWDDRSTPNVHEDRDAILRASLAAAYTNTVRLHGEPGRGWRWGDIRFASIQHLLRIPALSRANLRIPAGGPGTLAPSSGDGNHGASWRMVVELGPEVRAWGTYPGGQSGNPASPRYDDHLPQWSAGALDTLRFPHTASELTGTRVWSTLTLAPRAK